MRPRQLGASVQKIPCFSLGPVLNYNSLEILDASACGFKPGASLIVLRFFGIAKLLSQASYEYTASGQFIFPLHSG
jgi:hypothetical protein